MTKRARPLLLAIAAATLVTAGCGTSGSSQVLYHEVRFQVAPASTGQGTFSVDALVADGVVFNFPAGTTFTTTGAFNFYLEGAAPPYSGTFVQQGTAPITASVFVDRNLVNEGNPTSGDGTTVTVTALDQGTPGVPPSQGQLVRFDICAPPPDSDGKCSTTNVSGVPAGIVGIPYNGSIGDEFMSHLLYIDATLTTPGIYFLQNARDSANGFFGSVSGQFLQAQLFLDSALQQTVSGTNELKLRKDLP